MSPFCRESKSKAMKRYRIICPECNAGFLVDLPEALIWERCPSCRIHIWDLYDALMAERHMPDDMKHNARHTQAGN